VKPRDLTPALLVAALIPVLACCASLTETSGRILDGSAFQEKILAEYRTNSGSGVRLDQVRKKDGAAFIVIRPDSWPNLRINGSFPDAEGNFYLNSLYFLCPSFAGWNEFTMELSGSGSFISDGNKGAVFRLKKPLEALDIKDGKIRRGNTRITGAQALTSLHNRRERIASLVQWMGTQPGLPEFANLDEFESHWNPILLPETVKARKRPDPWKETEAVWVYSGSAAGSSGEDIKWNNVYTEKVFPEELWPVRNSGTLLRDWEEASGWIYFEFEWEHIIEALTRTMNLKKVK
jgi:hypothetical protein